MTRTPAPPPTAAPPPPTRTSRFRTFESLSNRSFRWFLFAALGQMASLRVQNIVRGYLAFELTNSFAALGAVFLANSLSGITLNFAGGVWADRIRRRKELVQVGQLLSASVGLVLGILVFTELLRFEHLLVAGFVTGGINALTNPSRQAMLPDVVGMEGLTNAVALNAAGRNVVQMVSPAIGGLIIAAFGAAWMYFLMTGTYLLAVACLTQVTTDARGDAPRRRVRSSPLEDLLAGLRYMVRDGRIGTVLLANTAFGLLTMPYEFLLPGFVADVLNDGVGNAAQLGFLLSIGALGALLGALAVASLPPRRRGLLYLASVLGMGLALLGFAASSTFWAAGVGMFALGIGRAGRMSLSNVLIQSYVEDAFRGRVMAVYSMQRSVASLGTFFVGIAAAILGIQLALGALALVVIALALALMSGGPMRRLD